MNSLGNEAYMQTLKMYSVKWYVVFMGKRGQNKAGSEMKIFLLGFISTLTFRNYQDVILNSFVPFSNIFFFQEMKLSVMVRSGHFHRVL